ncbi:membrane bound C2 domain protein (vp115), putative [Talaromyces stipitatus ATCC 10500]|uniref:Membrane bound C2 domain protein (Vp115), putative n=1 Tax=Talaromyces stipitatus (strain ATCC 10500 / CBS 375.48 / QM 6759 / NRRL 1006) TaxID=441959 RepID=B8M684_TALSN|nr:membrane bound C2 domain protein (vp115), putative [Talaromyces stipitatus ATCC 10500]EED19084.1 membrane bound C2 domain protein (vp115), putative [Talaromyces stipitatus ATCC 10500]
MATDSSQTETKQQGIIETAQAAASDPQSKIQPELIEKKLVEESRKAGAVAYQFDPNASPEEKAQAANAILPPGFHNPNKQKGLALVSDNDLTGPPQYDLPSTNQASAEVKQAPTLNGAEKRSAQNGQLTEDQRWARDRTGWAPQFAKPDEKREEGETLLDHRTFLEEKLSDKFYGDWYHNAAVIVFACLSSWIIAVLGGGLGWVFLVMAACGTYYRTSIRRVRRNFRDDVHREMAKQRLETDSESLEWINGFLLKFWPIYAPVLCDTIINSVDQVLSTSTPAFLDSLRMKTFVLGTKPPRLEHVKTYPKTEVDTVIMDWKFSFTPNDTMDMTARELKDKINPKVVLEVRVGKGVVSHGLDVIVEDFAFSGLMRVKMKLQIPFPHIERVDISFMERPEIDYVCKPLGGDHLGFDINFIPGLEGFIKEQIHGNLGPMMYEPNVFPIEIAKMLAGNPVDQAIGVLAVTLHGAANLKGSGRIGNTVDPYCSISINNRNELARTKTIRDTTEPRWNETHYIIITSFTDSLTVGVFDYNDVRKDQELGIATFPLDKLESESEHEGLALDISYSGRSRGVLRADVRFFPVLEGRRLEDGTEEPAPELNTGVARFTVEQAKELDGSKSLVGSLNPYAVLILNGKEVHVTKKLKRTNNPIFQNSSKELLITDRKHAKLGLLIKDDRDLATDPVIGKYQIKLNDMLKMMDKGQEWYQLHGAKSGRVKMMLDWKPVALRGIVGGAGYVPPIGVARIHFKSAKDLRNVETMGKSDPYARVLLNGIPSGRTVTYKNNLNPDWDEIVYVPVHNVREKLTLEVMDEESLSKDRSLGEVEVSLSDYIHEDENGEYEVDEEKQDIQSGLRMNGRGTAKGFLNYNIAFYPALNVYDPEEDAEEEEEEEELSGLPSRGHSKQNSVDSTRKSVDRKSIDAPRASTDIKSNGRPSIDTALSKAASNGGLETPTSTKAMAHGRPKIRIEAADLTKYESGLIVFKLIDGQLSHTNVYLEVLVDDHMFPSYTSMKIKSREATFQDVGDAFIRELDMSQITLRLVEKSSDKDEKHVIAKLTGDTLSTLQRCLYTPTELQLRAENGAISKIKVSLRFIPVMMKLDPRESINNSGELRVDVLDAADLPSADRNGYSDPYCKFKLDGKDVYKTKVQKKTLHPAWNEFFETSIKSRIGANFRVDVWDWDFGDKADFLGGADINLEMLEPFHSQEVTLDLDGKSGAIRLKLLFKPSYVTRTRQGQSTMSGTFAVPGKIVGAPVKGVGLVGGGVVKGASFLGRGLKNRFTHKDSESNGTSTPIREESPPQTPNKPTEQQGGGLARAPGLVVEPSSPSSSVDTPGPLNRRHSRTKSVKSLLGEKGTPGSIGAETGSAMFTIVSASGFPPSANVRCHVRLLGAKGTKEVHKTKAVKSSDGSVQFDASHETFKVPHVPADAQYQLKVVDHSTFGSDAGLGEALFFVDDQGTAMSKEKTVTVGTGSVVIKSSFAPSDLSNGRPSTSHSVNLDPADANGETPDKKRRSFLSKRSVSGA